MTHILHRQIGHAYPVAASGQGVVHPRQRRQGVHRRLGRRGGVLPGAFAPGGAGGDARAARHARLCAYQLLHHAGRGGTGRRSGRACPGGHRPRFFRQRRVGGDRGRAQACAPIFRRARRAAAAIRHRPAPELSRHHAGRARGRRARVAAPTICAAADRDPPRVAGLRVSRPRRGRDAASLWRAPGATSSKPRSKSSAATTSSPSSPRRWSAPPWARSRRCRAISSACARSATATASCSFSTR